MLEKAFRINKPNDYNEMLKLSRIFLATVTPKSTVHLSPFRSLHQLTVDFCLIVWGFF